MSANKNLEKLHGWFITYNALSNIWLAATNEFRPNMTNNVFSYNVLRAKDFPTLQAILAQYGDKPAAEINKIYDSKTQTKC